MNISFVGEHRLDVFTYYVVIIKTPFGWHTRVQFDELLKEKVLHHGDILRQAL